MRILGLTTAATTAPTGAAAPRTRATRQRDGLGCARPPAASGRPTRGRRDRAKPGNHRTITDSRVGGIFIRIVSMAYRGNGGAVRRNQRAGVLESPDKAGNRLALAGGARCPFPVRHRRGELAFRQLSRTRSTSPGDLLRGEPDSLPSGARKLTDRIEDSAPNRYRHASTNPTNAPTPGRVSPLRAVRARNARRPADYQDHRDRGSPDPADGEPAADRHGPGKGDAERAATCFPSGRGRVFPK